jgi:hypothetical protein
MTQHRERTRGRPLGGSGRRVAGHRPKVAAVPSAVSTSDPTAGRTGRSLDGIDGRTFRDAQWCMTSGSLVGRDDELSTIRELLTRPGATVVVAAGAGVGKTRLLRELASGATEIGLDVVRMAGNPALTSLAFGAVARPIRTGRPMARKSWRTCT